MYVVYRVGGIPICQRKMGNVVPAPFVGMLNADDDAAARCHRPFFVPLSESCSIFIQATKRGFERMCKGE